ncbi:cell wall-binding protein [Bacillus nitratireducens]|uniref:cell wall-binding protein n=1 Tax=Bacillus nitratireducens TaxID=2026193 RepID=UPI002E20F502|nr:cell wall-binding protein [Bacillus nitratireducens]
MIKKTKKGMRKALPVGLAMGVLFSGIPLATPLTEHKVQADVDTAATIITTIGSIYEAFAAEAFGKWLEDVNAKTSYDNFYENITYMAPTFQKGEFGISAFDYYKNRDFSKTIKLSYPNGKVEYKTIKHGQQIRIKQAGTIVDLTPDEPDPLKHDILYITQKQLDEGNTAVSLTNFKTYYLQSDNSSRRNDLGYKYLKQHFPNAYHNGIRNFGVDEDELFKKLPAEKQTLGTSTSKTVEKDVLSNYATNDPEAREDLKKRTLDVFTNHKAGGYSSISTKIINDGINLEAGDYVHEEGNSDPNRGTDFTITPIQKGSNKVIVSSVFNEKVRYLTSKLGDHSQWIYTHDGDISSDEIWDLVVRKDGQFSLKNNKGQYLYVPRTGKSAPAWTTDDINTASKLTARLAANEWNNWLIDWHPRKENETKKHEGKTYDGLEFKSDAKDGSIWIAYNSGKLITNSWIKRGDSHYYADSSGILLKGWKEIEGNTYYFHPGDNSRVNGSEVQIEDKYYNFTDDGVLKKATWTETRYGLSYSDASGALIKEGLKEIDGQIYYFKNYHATTGKLPLEDQGVTLRFSDEGRLMFVSGLDGKALNSIANVSLDNKTLAFRKTGEVEAIGVTKYPDGRVTYYSLEDGPLYSGWKELYGKKYHFTNGQSSAVNGTATIDGKTYYFNESGETTLTGFVKKDGKTYYYDDKGKMLTGWQQINGKWHSFEDSGEATVGKFTAWSRTSGQFGQYNFYAKENGEIYVNETVRLETIHGYRDHIFDEYGHLTIKWDS